MSQESDLLTRELSGAKINSTDAPDGRPGTTPSQMDNIHDMEANIRLLALMADNAANVATSSKDTDPAMYKAATDMATSFNDSAVQLKLVLAFTTLRLKSDAQQATDLLLNFARAKTFGTNIA